MTSRLRLRDRTAAAASAARTAFAAAAIVTAVLLAAAPAAAAPTPAGTLIRNVAEATYFNARLGITERLVSNPVTAEVASVPAIEAEGDSLLTLTRGAPGTYLFTVSNTGNVALLARPSVVDTRNGQLVSAARLFLDRDGNGRIDPADPEILRGTEIPLAPGEAVVLIRVFDVDRTAHEGDALRARLDVPTRLAGGREDGPRARAAAAAVIVATALEIEKTQEVARTGTGEILTYALHLRNDGETPLPPVARVEGEPLRIDGIPRAGVLVADDIPLNARFRAVEDAGGLTPLYRTAADEAQDWSTAAPAEPARVAAIGFFREGPYGVGQSNVPRFSVDVPDELGAVEIRNVARTYLPEGGAVEILPSNPVRFRRDAPGGAIRFTDGDYAAAAVTGRPGGDVRLVVVSAACNLGHRIDEVTISVRSPATGDLETVVARETGPNTARFHAPALPLVRRAPARAGDGVLATEGDDRIEASALCGEVLLTDALPILPGAHVFDSVTNAPIPGVTLRLVSARSGRALARTTADDAAWFAWGDMPAGEYRLLVDAPGWAFPTARIDFPGFDRDVAAAGFGRTFTHPGGPLAATDVPLDPRVPLPVSLEKSADRALVRTGGVAGYRLVAGNNMEQGLTGAVLRDTPPTGTTLVSGSVTIDGTPAPDPLTDADGALAFALGDLPPRSTVEIGYTLRFGAAARPGPNENRAMLAGRQAGTGAEVASPVARAVLRLDDRGGVFSPEGTVLGSVFLDCDGDGLRGDETREPGIPGVRLVTQEGRSVVTDVEGRYSLPAMRPVTHAIQVQEGTLPLGTEVAVTRTRDLRRGGSRLVPVMRGEMRQEHFAVRTCTPGAMDEVIARRALFTGAPSPAARAGELPFDTSEFGRATARTEAGLPTTTQLTPEAVARAGTEARTAGTGPVAPNRPRPLAQLLDGLDDAAGFLDLEDGARVARRTLPVRVKGKADLTLSLFVNGTELGADRVGERSSRASDNLQALEYVAVRLRAGRNELTLVGRDPFGIERTRETISVTAPGDPARLRIALPETAPAAPASRVPVVVRVTDAAGQPVPAATVVTLSARRGLWDVDDIRPGQPGVQAYLDGGEATFLLIPPQVSGTDRITVSTGFDRAEARIAFTPDLDDRVLVGVIQGAVSLGGDDAGTLIEADRLGGFAPVAEGLRGEVYLKGAIRGDALLTLRYASDRDTEDRLFRDVRGDEYYPVYGDASERGYDAAANAGLYVKVERGRSYLLYGDFAIEPEAPSFRLDGQRRVATGAQGHWENDRVSVTVFAAHTRQTQRVAEIAGRGVSGPYDLALAGFVQGSERVERLVRDRDGGDVVASETLRRGTDYLFDVFADTITFAVPLSQTDGFGNPVSVRVTYEVEADGAGRHWLYGGEVNVALGERTIAGLRAVESDGEVGTEAHGAVRSAFLRHEDARGAVWEAEAAQSVDDDGASDTALRLSYAREDERNSFALEVVHAGEDFVARGGLARAGTTAVRAGYARRIDEDTALSLSAEYVRDRPAGTETLGLGAELSFRVSARLSADVGIDHQLRLDGGARSTALLMGARWTPKARPDTAIDARLRWVVDGVDARPATLSLSMMREPAPGWTSFSETEIDASDGLRSTTRMGFAFRPSDWLGTRLELARAAGERDTVMTSGLTLGRRVAGVDLDATVEHSRRMAESRSELTSLAIGARWGSEEAGIVGDAAVETTWEAGGRTHYASLGIAGELTEDLTVLARTRIALDRRDGGDTRRMRTRLGAAWRPAGDPRLEVLAWYEHRLEQRHGREDSHLWSVDAGWEPDADTRLRAKWAGRDHAVALPGGGRDRALTQLVQGGAERDLFGDRFLVGLDAAHLWDDRGGRATGLGAELGFSPREGLMVALGYRRLSGEVAGGRRAWREGVALRFDLLLDDGLRDRLGWFMAD